MNVEVHNQDLLNTRLHKSIKGTPAPDNMKAVLWGKDGEEGIEVYENGVYLISIGKFNELIEVFELQHGAPVDDNGEWCGDGELWQYRLFKTWKRAINYAVNKRFKRVKNPIKKW